MNLLAIDTSSVACSVALLFDGEVSEQHVVEPREHTRILMPMITAVLGGRALTRLDAIVLGNGPGSFIGMRIGASVVQGLCYGAGLPIIPVSSLAAVAAEVFERHDVSRVAVAQDARMHEVYFCSYRRMANGLPQEDTDEAILPADELPLGDSPCAVAGGAWVRYPELQVANQDSVLSVVPVVVPRARLLLRLGAAVGTPIPPESLVPAYLRTKVAEKPSPAK